MRRSCLLINILLRVASSLRTLNAFRFYVLNFQSSLLELELENTERRDLFVQFKTISGLFLKDILLWLI